MLDLLGGSCGTTREDPFIGAILRKNLVMFVEVVFDFCHSRLKVLFIRPNFQFFGG